jgi:type I restriction enzyme S subunit
MSENQSKLKIPKLRFQAFSGKWEEKKLGEVSTPLVYGMNSAAKEYDGENIYLRITDIDSSSGRLKKEGLTSPCGKLEDSYRLKDGDLLFTRTGASVGKTYLYKKTDGRLYFAGFLIKGNIEKANPYFVYLLTLQRKYSKFVESVSMRSGQPGINAKEYAEFKLTLPSILEQQKIAEFLESNDQWIENLKVQKESFESYKKGMMQKLFSQEIRFKDDKGKEFPKWEEKKLNSISLIKKGNQLNREGLSRDTGYPVINGGIEPSGYTNVCNTQGKTITISEGGNSCGYVNYIKQDFWCGGHCYSLINLDKDIDLSFLYQSLKFLEKNIMMLRVGSGLPNIQKKDIDKFKLKIPEILEQQKISDFLTSVDKVIQSKQQQIAQAELWKKGLMQGLFV